MKHIHLIGIGGSGLSAIALLLKERGYTVSGSDRSLTPITRQLASQGITVYAGHDAENVRGADLVVRSSAVPMDNPEVIAASTFGIPVMKRSDFLGELMRDFYSIAVAGTHGKTTTTAMIAWIYTCLKQDPSFIIGGVSKNLGTNAHAGKGTAFIIEADEYDHMFLGLSPDLEVVTTMEHDHPDIFPTLESYRADFVQFVGRLSRKGTLLTCGEDPGASWLATNHGRTDIHVLSYGFTEDCAYQAKNLQVNSAGGFDFDVWLNRLEGASEVLASVSLQVPGEHNVLNGLAALAASHQAGLSAQSIAAALAEFTGTGRRFDRLGSALNIEVVDDYAHHPTEVRATLAAARSRYAGRRIWAVWQPHTYSRLMTLMDEFTSAFSLADRVIVTEVYAARERMEGFSAAQVVEKMGHPSVKFISSLTDVSQYLMEHLQPNDVLLVLSAGDADQISAQVLSGLKQREANHA